MIIAIDGPAGAGKSSVSKQVAQRLGFQLLDTGAIYRCVALFALREGLSWDAEEQIADIACRLNVRFSFQGDLNTVHASLGAHDMEEVTPLIRTPDISQGTSRISAHPKVRAALLELQRSIGKSTDSVVEGRDIGTVVFPEAKVKIFLTASTNERARRRREQLLSTTEQVALVPDLATIASEIHERDTRDSMRAIAPLKQAKDATLLDSTALTPDEVIDRIVERAK